MFDEHRGGRPRYEPPPQKYSVITDHDGGAHAVLDGIVRAVFHNDTYAAGLLALCGKKIHPCYQPHSAAPCPGCTNELNRLGAPGVEPRPAPGNPLLKLMGYLHSCDEDTRCAGS